MTLYSSAQLAIKARAEHAREAARLTAIAATVTTPAVRAQVLAMVQEHARLAARQGDGGEFFESD
jgi:hypothetical protein